MRATFLFLSTLLSCCCAQYETQTSGYGTNNPYEVQKVAKQSPQTRTADYTSYKAPRSGRKPDLQKVEQTKTSKETQEFTMSGSRSRNESATTAQPNNQSLNSRNGISALVYNTAGGTLIVPVLHSFLYGGAANGFGGNLLGTPIQLSGNAFERRRSNKADANAGVNQQNQANAGIETSLNAVNPSGIFAGAPIFIPNLNSLFQGNFLLPSFQQVNQQESSNHIQHQAQPPSYQAPRPDPTYEDGQSNYDNQQPGPVTSAYSRPTSYSTPPSTAATFPTLMTSPTPPTAEYNRPEPINPYRHRRH